MNVGLFFGSFNPIHIGHLIIINHILNETKLKKIWLIVSPQNPLKKPSTLLNEFDRLHLVRLAVEGDNRIKTSDVEFKLPRPSFTVDTLTHLKEAYPQSNFSLIIGGDSYQNLNRWKNFERIISEHEIYVFQRKGFEISEGQPPGIHLLKAPLLDISSTYIRNLIKEKKSIRYLVPENVREEIETRRYYKS